MPDQLFITDVGPRDGLQSQKTPVDTAGKRALINALWVAGVRGIEATSFVSSKAVPQMAETGAGEVVIADTIGAAAPRDVDALFEPLVQVIPAERLGIHLHDTRGMALANAWAAIGHGIRRFDSSIGGLGGCPFAPGAAGNLATEDLVLMAQQCGFNTGIDLPALMAAVDLAGRLVGYEVGGRSARWLRRPAT